jgi:hypothetical protein
METINKQAAPNAAREQGTSSAPQRKGGFVQGAAVAQGCCGETSSGSGGCCDAPAQAAVPGAAVQVAVQGGCCGVPAAKTEATSSSTNCCG